MYTFVQKKAALKVSWELVQKKVSLTILLGCGMCIAHTWISVETVLSIRNDISTNNEG